MEVISRKEARARGLIHYFTGKPCRHGHVCLRYVKAAKCIECGVINSRRSIPGNLESVRESKRKWARNNQDKIKAYYEANYEKWVRSGRRWRERNAEFDKERALRWRRANPDLARAVTKRWRQKATSKELMIAKENRRRARKREVGGSYTPEEAAKILEMQGGKCAYCGGDLTKRNRHLDHITPLCIGGSNSKENLQYLCGTCNLRKGKKHPLEFARIQGRLL